MNIKLINISKKLGLIEIPVGFTMAMSCIMGSRLVLNVRFMKRELELGIYNRERSLLHIPFNSRPAAVFTPVVFADYQGPSTVDTESISPSTEYIEMQESRSSGTALVPLGLAL